MTLKRIRFGRPLQDVTLDRFREVWQVEHAPRVALMTQALRYIGTFFEPIDEVRPPWDHAVSLWYRDAQHQRQAYAGPRDPTDPIGTVMDTQSILLETIEHALQAAPEAGLSQTWFVVPTGASAQAGALSEDCRPDVAEALRQFSTSVRPVRCTVSIATPDSTSREFAAVIELGYDSSMAREVGDASLIARGGIWAAATRYVVGDQVAIIGDLADSFGSADEGPA